MTSQFPDVTLRLNLLAERIGRIERHLGLDPFRAAINPPPARETPSSVSVAPVATLPEAARPTLDTPAVPVPRRETLRSMLDAADRDTKERLASEAFSIERLIGQRWFAAAGALIVVIGVGLFFKLAYDLGWLGRLPPELRCVSGALFGAALLGLGEWLHRKIGAAAAAGASAAGVGVLYASAYAAYGLFGLVSPTGAVAMLTACIALGLMVGARSGLAAVAAVSLAGGYITPLLLADSGASRLFLPAYLIALLLVAQGLVAWKSLKLPSFVWLRWMAWGGTLALGTMWLALDGYHVALWALGFIAAVWGLVQGEMLLTARRADALVAARSRDDEGGGERFITVPEGPAFLRHGAWIAASMSLTAWATLFATWLVADSLKLAQWLAPAAGFASTFALAAVFAGHLRAFIDPPRSAGERFGAGFLLQAAALLAVTLALALSGWALVLSWLAVGLAAIAAGRWIGSRALDVYGVVNLGMATAAFVLSGLVASPAATATVDYWGIPMSLVQWRGLLVGTAWLAGSALLLWRNAGGAWLRTPLMLIGVFILAIAPAGDRASMVSLMIYWVGLASVLAAAGLAAPRLHLGTAGLAVASTALLAWGITYVFRWTPSSASIFAHPGLWTAILIGAALVLIGRRGQPGLPPEARASISELSGAAVAGTIFVASSFELARVAAILTSEGTAARAAVSIYWGLLAIGLLWRGFVAGRARVRYLGLGLMAIAALKVVIVDLAGIAPVWRVVSFIVLGLLMLAVAAGYGWVIRRGRAPQDSATVGTLPL
jgi:hypothetical protein